MSIKVCIASLSAQGGGKKNAGDISERASKNLIFFHCYYVCINLNSDFFFFFTTIYCDS